MTLTDQDVLGEVQDLLAEPSNGGASWSSGMWTPEEAVGYLNDRQQGVFADTGLKVKRVVLPCAPFATAQALPGDWIATLRVVWVRASDGRHFVLDRADGWELDAAAPDWRTSPGTPAAYTDADTPTLEMQLAPAAASAGDLKLTYLALPVVCDGSGISLDVPDEVAPGLVWGVISRMLNKEGRAKDPSRADTAEQRYRLVVEAVKILMQGWEG